MWSSIVKILQDDSCRRLIFFHHLFVIYLRLYSVYILHCARKRFSQQKQKQLQEVFIFSLHTGFTTALIHGCTAIELVIETLYMASFKLINRPGGLL